MIVRNPDQRVVVLVDVQNMYYSARNLFNSRLNFTKLLEIAVAKRLLVRAIAYVIKSEDNDSSEFFEAVHTAGFEIREKNLQVFSDGHSKGDWDLGMAMDAIRLGQKVDSVVLVSGDGDFVPLVNYLQQSMGCLVEVVAFKKTANDELMAIADDFIDIEEHRKDLMFRSKVQRRRGAFKKKK